MFPFLQLFWPDPVFHCTVVPHHSGALRDLTSFGNMWFQTSCDTCVDEVTGCCHSSDEWECEECDESWQVSVPRGTWLHHLPRGSQVLEGLNQSVQQLKRGAPFSPFPIVYIHHYILQTHLQSFHRALGYRIVVSITKESEAWICCLYFACVLTSLWLPLGARSFQGIDSFLYHPLSCSKVFSALEFQRPTIMMIAVNIRSSSVRAQEQWKLRSGCCPERHSRWYIKSLGRQF